MTLPLADMLALVAFLLFVGGAAGVLAGLLGVGGGIVIVPALFAVFSALGHPPETLMHVCVATSLATIVPTSLRSMAAHHKKGAVDWSVLKSWAPFMGAGALLGVLAADRLKSDSLMLVFGALAFLVALYMALGRVSWRIGEAPPRGWKGAALSAPMGFASALMGIGGGTFGVPALTLFGLPVHRAVATAAGFGLVIAVPAAAGFVLSGLAVENRPDFTLGYVHLPAFAIIVPMTVLFAPVGVKIAHSIDPRPLKLLFALFLAATALNMARKAMGG